MFRQAGLYFHCKLSKEYAIKKIVFAIIVFALIISAGVVMRPKASQVTATPAAATGPDGSKGGFYTKAQVTAHSSASDCWTIISGSVYDLTSFIPQHPGGEQILQACGIDATQLFESQPGHGGRQAQGDLAQLKIGSLTQ